MKRMFAGLIGIVAMLQSCENTSKPNFEVAGRQSEIVVSLIEAVNEKDAGKYVASFAENVEIFIDSKMVISGREAIKVNRANHFENHPEIRSEIQYLVEIDNKVVLHDKVWLDEADVNGQNIVEVFTFNDGEVVRVDVIQPRDLLSN
ncbi:MAG: nuclear transport factor 2 family protein [Bacteroidota bacterium]